MTLLPAEQIRRLAMVIDSTAEFIAIAGLDGQVESVNGAGRHLVGMPDEVDVTQTKIEDYLTPETVTAGTDTEVPSSSRTRGWREATLLRDWRGGPPVPVVSTSIVIPDASTGEPVALAMMYRDLREGLEAGQRLARALRALRENEDRQKALLVHMCDILVVIGADGMVRSTSRSAGPSLGYQFGEKIGSSVYDLVHPEDRARTASVLTEVGAQAGLSRPLEVRLLSSDGSWRRYEFVANNLINDPKICGILVAARDVTARRLAEQSLVSQARILELIARRTSLAKVLIALAEEVQAELPDTLCSVLLLEGTGRSRVLRYAAAPSLPDAYRIAVDRLSVNTAFSPCAKAILTARPVLVADLFEDQTWGEFRDLAIACGVRACWSMPVRSPATGLMIGTFALYQTTAGLPGPEILEVIGRASHLIGIAVDREAFEVDRARAQAEQDRLQRRLHQAQRLESLGQLAGGIAHDFNNLLGIISSYATFVGETVSEAAIKAGGEYWEPARRDLEQIEAATKRAAGLVHQLLAFARREEVQPQVMSLNTVIERLKHLLGRTLGDHITMELVLASDSEVLADAGQIDQVLLNLAINARDAMPHGGILTFETSDINLSHAVGDPQSDPTFGPYVQLCVRDTGVGIPRDIVDHVFEPFFTTKPDREGTGLGLATVYGIITQAGGHIQIHSEPGIGTTFTIQLPLIEQGANVNVQLS